MASRLSPTMLRPLHRRHIALRARYPPGALRTISSRVHRLPTTPSEEGEDFRPPWFYTLARVLSWTLIPATVFYGVFMYDFGEHEHVFQPARRWAERQKAGFLTLSADEKKIVGDEPTQRKS
ncbi:hypothetical protein D9615_002799 [Tricholomella constricta]|uniref:Uncharacterized protein n=1 Tax=Tricholomella constricta TaxID=117010 RepID=A0A8H5M6L2_9AGAR|nr:hypothetical protein D9615_002799 [Tricholomella constricta]